MPRPLASPPAGAQITTYSMGGYAPSDMASPAALSITNLTALASGSTVAGSFVVRAGAGVRAGRRGRGSPLPIMVSAGLLWPPCTAAPRGWPLVLLPICLHAPPGCPLTSPPRPAPPHPAPAPAQVELPTAQVQAPTFNLLFASGPVDASGAMQRHSESVSADLGLASGALAGASSVGGPLNQAMKEVGWQQGGNLAGAGCGPCLRVQLSWGHLRRGAGGGACTPAPSPAPAVRALTARRRPCGPFPPRQAHMWLMALSWGLFIPAGIVMARCFKEMDPFWCAGSGFLWACCFFLLHPLLPRWAALVPMPLHHHPPPRPARLLRRFQVHRAVQTLGVVMTVVGLALGFSLRKQWGTPYTVHRDLGIAIMVLAALQVRWGCQPSSAGGQGGSGAGAGGPFRMRAVPDGAGTSSAHGGPAGGQSTVACCSCPPAMPAPQCTLR